MKTRLVDTGPLVAYLDARDPGHTTVVAHDAAALMEKYADTPMDFADATLVLLAEALGLDIFTLDRRGFSVYRTRNGRALRPVLGMN